MLTHIKQVNYCLNYKNSETTKKKTYQFWNFMHTANINATEQIAFIGLTSRVLNVCVCSMAIWVHVS